MDCVEVCPVDCFYEGENMLVIHPDECIDCGVCEPECPVDAIKADSEPEAVAAGMGVEQCKLLLSMHSIVRSSMSSTMQRGTRSKRAQNRSISSRQASACHLQGRIATQHIKVV